MRFSTTFIALCSALLSIALTTGCGGDKVTITIDGSSTVFPITEVVAEEFNKQHPGVRIAVGVSGTGGGFKKFCIGEIDINDASRAVKEKEIAKAVENKIEFIEIPVAFDGLSVVANPKNTFLDALTVAELNKIWEPGSKITKWSQVRDGWPEAEMKLYGPGTDSGTFDYFTEAINGEAQACRADFTKSEDDNVLVRGVAGDQHSLGFFGFAYYIENKDKLKVVPIDPGTGGVAPTMETINNGTYTPLSRPIFIYVSKAAAERKEVQDFVTFYLKNAPKLVKEVGYVPLPQAAYDLALERFEKRVTGSVFSGKKTAGTPIESFLKIQ